MADVERPKPVAFQEKLSKAEAEERFVEVNGIVDEIRLKYALPADGFTMSHVKADQMKPEDQELLQKCMGVLIGICTLQSVAVEAAREDIPTQEMLLARAMNMQMEVMMFAASFEGSGIHVQMGSAEETRSSSPKVRRGLLDGAKKLFRRK